MTLRDYFAATALPAILNAMFALGSEKRYTYQESIDSAVQLSIYAADAMFAERERKRG